MEYTLQEKYELIKKECLKKDSCNVFAILKDIMKMDFINIHGPEHHFLDGAALLTAYSNVKKDFVLDVALDKLAKRSITMPGAMCGYWGICGSVTSVGACLSIINNTNPLSDDIYYKDNMEFTSRVTSIMSKLGGPRCCKRSAFISLSEGVKFINEKYGVKIESGKVVCDFSSLNNQCVKEKCPFYNKG